MSAPKAGLNIGDLKNRTGTGGIQPIWSFRPLEDDKLTRAIRLQGKTIGKPELRSHWSEGGDYNDQTCPFIQQNCHQRGRKGCRNPACLSDLEASETQTAGETPLKTDRAQTEKDSDGDIYHLETCRQSLSEGNGRETLWATDSEKDHLKKRVGMKPKLHQSQWHLKGFGNGPTNDIDLCCDGVHLVHRNPDKMPREIAVELSCCRFGPDPIQTESLRIKGRRFTDGLTHRQIKWEWNDIPLVQFKCVCQKTNSPRLLRLRTGMDQLKGIRADRWPLAYQSEPEDPATEELKGQTVSKLSGKGCCV